MTEQEQRSELAIQVIENPIFQEAADRMRAEIIQRWIKADAVGVRDLAWHDIHFLDKFLETLRGYIQHSAVKRTDLP